MARVLLLLAAVMALLYAWAPIYRFPPPIPFAGREILNPYDGGGGTWQRANLHAHSLVWGGLTSGRQPADEIVRRYRWYGYAVPGVSDYQRITAHEGIDTLALYEHGFNLGRRHQIVVGARSVSWFDFPLWQAPSHQQHVIDTLARSADLVALAHPLRSAAYTADDLRRLTGYHLLEVGNGPHRGDEAWDAALSAGRRVWAVAGDDTHNLDEPARTAMTWTMIDAPSASPTDIVSALAAGRAYAVIRHQKGPGLTDTVLEGVQLTGRTITVTCSGEPSTFHFIGQGGAVRAQRVATTSASYTFQDDDTYIRTFIESPRTTMFLNPMIRYDPGALDGPVATVDHAATWLFRGSLAAAVVGIGLYRRLRRRRCALLTLVTACLLTSHAEAQPAPHEPTLASVLDAATLRDLPASDSLFAVIEITQPSLIADRFSQGGLSLGQPARIGGFLSSWTQTEFRLDGVDLTDSRGNGRPLLYPHLLPWERILIDTVLPAADVNPAGVAVAIEPRRPPSSWTRSVHASTSRLGLAPGPATGAPTLARLGEWASVSALAGGPVVGERLGALVSATWAHASRFDRAETAAVASSLASGFAHVVMNTASRGEIRAIGWTDRSRAPFQYRGAFGQADATATAVATHLQATWATRSRGIRRKAFGSYTT
jgi:hypothetical protein